LIKICTETALLVDHVTSGVDKGGWGDAISPPKTYESNFIHHDFAQLEQ